MALTYRELGGNAPIGRTSSSSGMSKDVELIGFEEVNAIFGRMMTTDYNLAKNFRAVIRKALQKARRNLSKDAARYLGSDPRHAARAVKHSVYKSLFGGNLSILQKRSASAKYNLVRTRKVEQNPHQRGGNRIPYSEKNSRLDAYFGSDRGFVLRFINSGTVTRQSRYGNRGSVRPTDWFGHTAPWQIEAAANEVAEAITQYINHETNG